MAPAPHKPREPGLDEALLALDRQHRRVVDALTTARHEAATRARSIRRALDLGATLRMIAERLDVSPETVRKMAEVTERPNR